VLASREASSAVRRAVFDWAAKIGQTRTEHAEAGKPLGWVRKAQGLLADLLVFSKIRGALGGRIKFLVSGGAPLAPEIARFLHGAGLLVLEGYGLTETTPILNLRIADDGEILAKGPNIALGYYKRPEETRAAWDSDGWFHTGDIGEIDSDGFLRITDRKKDLIKTSGGKYVAPQKVENLLKTQPHISQAVVIGDRRRYCVALLTLDAAEVETWAAKQGISLPADRAAWAQDERVRALIESEVAAVNRHLASYESVKYFRIVPREFTVETGELTPSLKVKRKVIAERYKDLIDEMY
jgi:long-chain acyl-CoA synthetase